MTDVRVRYRMIDPYGVAHWLTEHECARALDGGWGDGVMALDLDTWTERRLTEAEKKHISFLSDEYSGSK
jgi:hypothetical protein